MDIRYLSHQGRRLKMYKLKSDYYALDSDIADFFEVEKKYMLSMASRRKEEFVKGSKIGLTRKECELMGVGTMKYNKSLYAFNVDGIIALTFCVNKGSVAAKMSVDVIRETGKTIDKMRIICKKIKEINEMKDETEKVLLFIERHKNKVPDENLKMYRELHAEICRNFENICKMETELREDKNSVKKHTNNMPAKFKKLFFPEIMPKNYKQKKNIY